MFADHHHICGEIAPALARIDAIMEGGKMTTSAYRVVVLDEVERALVNAGVVLHRAQVTATMDCINASASDPAATLRKV